MTFTIYSIGDSAFLEQILLAVAMITGTGDFEQMVAIGLLIGVLIMAFQSLFKGAKQIDFQQILVAWVLYATMFGPSSTVVIEDSYNGQVRVVSNVPIGVGAAGGIISNIGYTLTDLFETGYGIITPGVTDSSFADALSLLNDARRNSYDSAIFTAWNQTLGGGFVDTRQSWSNYIRDCSLMKIDLGLASVDDVMQAPITEALRFNSLSHGTRIFLRPASPNGEDLVCTQAYGKLMIATQDGFLGNQAVSNVLSDLLGIDNSWGVNAFDEIGNALQALGASTTSPFDYIQTAILEPLYYEAASGRYQDLRDFSSAIMVNQALQQRNTQWAAEQTMFMTIVHPMMTFVEGFVYAVTPIMAFILVFGSPGIKLIVKYAQFLIWIQLWMPVLSIINLYIHMSASNQMASYAGSGLNSMYALNSADQVLQHWIATGGMLAAATPILSLVLVTGSTYAMTSLAGRMQGGDHIDESVSSPDALKQGAMMNSMPKYQHDQVTGTHATGSESLMSSMSMGSMIGSSVSSASARQEQTSEQFTKTLGSGITDAASQSESYARLSDLGRTMASQGGSAYQSIEGTSKQFMEDHNIGSQHKEAVEGAVSLAATGTVDGDKLLAQVAGSLAGGPVGAAAAGAASGASPIQATGTLQGKGTESTTDSSSSSYVNSDKYMEQLGLSDAESAQLTNQLAEGYSNRSGQQFASTWGSELSEKLASTAGTAVQASESYSDISQISDQLGAMSNTDFRTLGSQVAGSPDASEWLNGHFNANANADVKQEAQDLFERYSSETYGMDPATALSAARLTAMTNANNFENGNELGGYDAALTAVGMATGRNLGIDADPYSNSDIATPGDDGLRDEVNQAIGDGPRHLDADNIRNMSETSPQDEAGRLPGTPSNAIMQDYGDNAWNVRDDATTANDYWNSTNEDRLRSNLTDSAPEMSLAASGAGFLDGTAIVDKYAGAAGVAMGVAGDSVIAATEQLDAMSPSDLAAFRNDLNSGEDLSGWGGALADLSSTAGNSLVGALVTGYDAASGGGEMFDGAAAGMSMEERGAYMSGALIAASQEGGAAGQEFIDSYAGNLREEMHDIATSRYGLTEDQADLFASAYGNDDGATQNALSALKDNYREADGSISPENEEFADQLSNIILNSTDAGDMAGSYLTPVSGYNTGHRGI